MGRHPRHNVIFQTGMCVFDCSAVANIIVVADNETGPHYLLLGFHGSDRTIRIGVEDREAAVDMVAHIKRGMVASLTGDWGLLDGPDLDGTPVD